MTSPAKEFDTIPMRKPNWDVEAIRAQFPILSRTVKNGKPLAYLDNAASKQKPKAVLAAMDACYSGYYANVHRGSHSLSMEATTAFEAAREKLRAFINAAHSHEVIWTKSTTESINLVANSFGSNLHAGDQIVVSTSEHHANIVPWQLLRDRRGVEIIPMPLLESGRIDLEALADHLGHAQGKVKMVAMTHASNALGVVNDVAKIVELAHAFDAKALIDGCQAVAHLPVDVQALDADFYVFSGHKMYGPTGVGVLYGKEALLEQMPPFQGGGEMIDRVTFERSTWARLPHKFEPGTPAIAEVIGLGAAVDFLQSINREAAHAHEQHLRRMTEAALEELGDVTIYGKTDDKLPIVSFNLKGIHHNDVASIVDEEGVALRAGHHCAQPLMDYLGVPGTARAAFTFYNTEAEVRQLINALATVQKLFR